MKSRERVSRVDPFPLKLSESNHDGSVSVPSAISSVRARAARWHEGEMGSAAVALRRIASRVSGALSITGAIGAGVLFAHGIPRCELEEAGPELPHARRGSARSELRGVR
jgi:hypothetical protein